MKTYVRVANGIVAEIILPVENDEGNEVPIEDRFTPDLVAMMVDVTNVAPQPECWWLYSNGKFSPPLSEG